MTFAELKQKIVELSPEERFQLSALLADLEQREEIQFRAIVDDRMRAIDQGKKVTAEEFEHRSKQRK
jgi:hypothetical protein